VVCDAGDVSAWYQCRTSKPLSLLAYTHTHTHTHCLSVDPVAAAKSTMKIRKKTHNWQEGFPHDM